MGPRDTRSIKHPDTCEPGVDVVLSYSAMSRAVMGPNFDAAPPQESAKYTIYVADIPFTSLFEMLSSSSLTYGPEVKTIKGLW